MKILINGKIECEWNGKIDKCRGCDEFIGWAKTASGKWIPLNRDEKYTAHWASCKNTDKFKGKR